MIKIINNKVFLDKKVVGEIENYTYITRRKTKEHFYRLNQGYPIAVEILEFLKKHNINTIKIIEIGKQTKVYLASIEAYLNGDLICHEPFEMQKVIPLKDMVSL